MFCRNNSPLHTTSVKYVSVSKRHYDFKQNLTKKVSENAFKSLYLVVKLNH